MSILKIFDTAVVAGKFYPFHKGHQKLIESARDDSEQVTVLVCWKYGESIPAEVRVQAIREMYPDVTVMAVPCIPNDDDSVGWGKYTLDILGFKPDAVYSSENYGQPYAFAMGASHVMVDFKRNNVPVSGTMIRENPMKYFDYIESPLMRERYALRIVVVGAESTGTTTLAESLAKHYNTVCVPEYGRSYTKWKYDTGNKEWEYHEFEHIAIEQNNLEDLYAKRANRVLICDTDSMATSHWCMRYVGRNITTSLNRSLEASYPYQLHTHYILTSDDIPFVQDKDNLRDGEHIRSDMHKSFQRALQFTDHVEVSGSHEQRMKYATYFINKLIVTNGGTICPYCKKVLYGQPVTHDEEGDVCHVSCRPDLV